MDVAPQSPPHRPPANDQEQPSWELARLRAELRAARELIGIAPAFFGFVSPEGIVLNLNDLALRVIGATREQVIGGRFWEQPWWSPLPESARAVRAAMERGASGRADTFDLEYWALGDGHGEVRWVCLEITPVHAAGGKVERLAITGVDITQRKVAEQSADRSLQRLEESERSFRSFIEAMPQMAFIADATGSITYFNRRWYDYIGGMLGTEGWGWKDRPVHLPEDRQRVIDRWTESIESGAPYEIEYRLRRHDGEYRWHLGRAIALRDADGHIARWIGTNTDIHDQRLTVQKLEAERDIRERFVFTLSHDLRNPLAAAKLSAQIVTRKASDVDHVLKYSRQIVQNLDRADRMIRDLLDASQLRAGETLPIHRERCDLTGIVEATLDELSSIHGERFRLVAPGPIEGSWSGAGIRRILENLCGNAIKYGAANRPITVTLRSGPPDARLEVHNEGVPIPASDQATIFTAFRRTESARAGVQKGWGLGLALVKGLADAHGGEAGVESSAVGTTFWVRLPLAAGR